MSDLKKIAAVFLLLSVFATTVSAQQTQSEYRMLEQPEEIRDLAIYSDETGVSAMAVTDPPAVEGEPQAVLYHNGESQFKYQGFGDQAFERADIGKDWASFQAEGGSYKVVERHSEGEHSYYTWGDSTQDYLTGDTLVTDRYIYFVLPSSFDNSANDTISQVPAPDRQGLANNYYGTGDYEYRKSGDYRDIRQLEETESEIALMNSASSDINNPENNIYIHSKSDLRFADSDLSPENAKTNYTILDTVNNFAISEDYLVFNTGATLEVVDRNNDRFDTLTPEQGVTSIGEVKIQDGTIYYTVEGDNPGMMRVEADSVKQEDDGRERILTYQIEQIDVHGEHLAYSSGNVGFIDTITEVAQEGTLSQAVDMLWEALGITDENNRQYATGTLVVLGLAALGAFVVKGSRDLGAGLGGVTGLLIASQTGLFPTEIVFIIGFVIVVWIARTVTGSGGGGGGV